MTQKMMSSTFCAVRQSSPGRCGRSGTGDSLRIALPAGVWFTSNNRSRAVGAFSSNNRRPMPVTTGCVVSVSVSMSPARNSARIVSIPPSTDMGPPSCSRRSRTYSIGSPLASVLFQGSSRGKVEEITCLCIGLIHCPNGSSDSGQYCDHSYQSRRPITVSAIGASDSAISSPSSAPKASNCQRWGFSTTPLAEWKRWAEVTRAMVVPFFRLGLSFDKTTLEPGTHRSRDDFSDRLVCPEVIGQPELAEYHCAHEVGDPCNSAAGDVEHVDRERRPLALTIRVVHRGSRLPIRSS